jgi:hypothetical protein
MPIDPYFRDSSFGPEVIQVMSDVLEDVCRSLEISGRRLSREAVAREILEVAAAGHRDPRNIRRLILQRVREDPYHMKPPTKSAPEPSRK